jgi:hypothetical protein
MITLIILLAIVSLGSIYLHLREVERDTNILRHTIAVNLSILEPELIQLKGKADAILSGSAPAPVGVTREAAESARGLIEKSETAAKAARAKLETASLSELGPMLTQVFDAMDQATEARIALGACESAGLHLLG